MCHFTWCVFHATLDGLQFFLLPVVLGTSLLSMGVSNTLYAVAFGWYFYITHLGYRGENVSQFFLTLINVTCIADCHSRYLFTKMKMNCLCDDSTSISFQY